MIGGLNKSETIRFEMVTETTMPSDDLVCPGGDFQTIGTATEKAIVPVSVLALTTDSK